MTCETCNGVGWLRIEDGGAGTARPCADCRDLAAIARARVLAVGVGAAELRLPKPEGDKAAKAMAWFASGGIGTDDRYYPTLLVEAPAPEATAALVHGLVAALALELHRGSPAVWLTPRIVAHELGLPPGESTKLDLALRARLVVVDGLRSDAPGKSWPDRRITEIVAERARHDRLTALGFPGKGRIWGEDAMRQAIGGGVRISWGNR